MEQYQIEVTVSRWENSLDRFGMPDEVRLVEARKTVELEDITNIDRVYDVFDDIKLATAIEIKRDLLSFQPDNAFDAYGETQLKENL